MWFGVDPTSLCMIVKKIEVLAQPGSRQDTTSVLYLVKKQLQGITYVLRWSCDSHIIRLAWETPTRWVTKVMWFMRIWQLWWYCIQVSGSAIVVQYNESRLGKEVRPNSMWTFLNILFVHNLLFTFSNNKVTFNFCIGFNRFSLQAHRLLFTWFVMSPFLFTESININA